MHPGSCGCRPMSSGRERVPWSVGVAMRIAALRGLIFGFVLAALAVTVSATTPEKDRWEPIRFLLGSWEGSGENSSVTHEYAVVLQDKFIKSRTRSETEPKNGATVGEVHEDEGFFSYDPQRATIVFRQFLSEGFVNTYVLEPRESSSEPLVFTSESCEGAGNLRARLIIHPLSPDQYRMVLELASPGKDFAACQTLTMQRIK